MLWASAAASITIVNAVVEKAPTEILVVDVRGIRVAYRRAGEGPPLVLLHGGPGHGGEWLHQLEGLADEFTVVAWDMPGCGASADPPTHWRTRDYAECLAAFLSTLGLRDPHLLGLSFGSGLALELYRWHPEIPRSLILASAYAGWSGSLGAQAAEQRRQRMLQMIDLPDIWAEQWLPTLLTDAAPPAARDELRAILTDFRPAGQRQLLLDSGFAEHDVRDVLPRIKIPTLLLYGELDVRSPKHVAEQMQASISGAQLVFMPGVGHMGSVEAPEVFNSELRRFLRHRLHA